MKLFKKDLLESGFTFPITKDSEKNRDTLTLYMEKMNVFVNIDKEDFTKGIDLKKLLDKIDSLCKDEMDDRINENESGESW